MIEQNRALGITWFAEVWDQANPHAIDKYLAPDARCYGFPEPDSVLDVDQYKAVHAQFIQTFSNIRVQIDDIVAEGDRIAIRWVCHMTHTGDGLGFAATGKQVTMGGSSFCTCRDGMIVEGWNFMDFTKVLAHLQA
jgi:predicted ester cyclase